MLDLRALIDKILTKLQTLQTNIDAKVSKAGDTMTGLLNINTSGNTVTIGSQNASFTHIYNSADIPFIFNKTVATTNGWLGTNTYPWYRLYIGKLTEATNTFADNNPKIVFQNSDGSQALSLTFTDYDSVQIPASLTLNGNQGNEWFISPNIKVTTALNLTKNTYCSWYQQRDYASIKFPGPISDASMYPRISMKTQSGDWTIATYGETLYFSNVTDANYSSSTNTQNGYFRIYNTGGVDTTGFYYRHGNALFTRKSKNKDNCSISAGSTAVIEFDISETGYTPYALYGYDLNNASSSGSGYSNCRVLAVKISGSNAYFQIKNEGSSAAKIRPYIYIVYMAA